VQFWDVKSYGMGFAYGVFLGHGFFGMMFAYGVFFGSWFFWHGFCISGIFRMQIACHFFWHDVCIFRPFNNGILNGQNIGPYVGMMFAYLGRSNMGF
jgi:hypothetical protein